MKFISSMIHTTCSPSDRQGSNFESCVWRTVSSHSSHHPHEVLLAQFSLYVHKGALKPDSFHFSCRRVVSEIHLFYDTHHIQSAVIIVVTILPQRQTVLTSKLLLLAFTGQSCPELPSRQNSLINVGLRLSSAVDGGSSLNQH